MSLPVADVKSFMYQLVSAVAFLHQHNVGHMRLRPACCFLSKEGVLKLGGLDSARVIAKGTFLSSSIPVVAATAADSAIPYCSPEVLLHEEQGLSADIWSIGCIFAELMTGMPERRKKRFFDLCSVKMKSNMPYHLASSIPCDAALL
jgi:serine/threonine protein kinase